MVWLAGGGAAPLGSRWIKSELGSSCTASSIGNRFEHEEKRRWRLMNRRLPWRCAAAGLNLFASAFFLFSVMKPFVLGWISEIGSLGGGMEVATVGDLVEVSLESLIAVVHGG
ncbi:hypothetical protein M0R45_035486 [Rubus argutus]|uniref:Uncharacterized protein n=1 Tax=Rubus argutus TaxID=59490 RepID=A0AAW1VYQ0_RUBAR